MEEKKRTWSWRALPARIAKWPLDSCVQNSWRGGRRRQGAGRGG